MLVWRGLMEAIYLGIKFLNHSRLLQKSQHNHDVKEKTERVQLDKH